MTWETGREMGLGAAILTTEGSNAAKDKIFGRHGLTNNENI